LNKGVHGVFDTKYNKAYFTFEKTEDFTYTTSAIDPDGNGIYTGYNTSIYDLYRQGQTLIIGGNPYYIISLTKEQLYSLKNRGMQKYTTTQTSTQTGTGVVHNRGTKVVHNRVHTKETKETNTKEIIHGDDSKKIQGIIDTFKEINENYKAFFANTTQREAITSLLKLHSKGEIEKYIYLAKFSFNNQFFPNFISPYELQQKWVKVDKFWRTKQISDKRYISEFERFYSELIRERDRDKPKEVLEVTIGGKKITYELNK